jgi:25S rRNA (adenine2142-N1)-methyltransferase
MGAPKKSHRKKLSQLSQGRPPTVHRPAPSLSSRATRSLIRSHHQLQKAHARAVAEGNEKLAHELEEQISAKGGLESYQLASKKGQSKERGGDSSKVLIDWLQPVLQELPSGTPPGQPRLRLLEVGALSTKNACSMVKSLEVTRIDLNSQEPGILQQDFMERPLPGSDADRFHVISLSLVLNYVPDPATRGQMLLRTTQFLAMPTSPAKDMLPCLFVVLPAACVLNSRYFTEKRLQEMMSSLGYAMLKRKVTAKLVYYLWHYRGATAAAPAKFRKEMLNDGLTRNNFAITLC